MLIEELAHNINSQLVGTVDLLSRLPLVFDNSTLDCKAAVTVTLDTEDPYRVLSAWSTEPWFFTMLLLRPLTLLHPDLGQTLAGLKFSLKDILVHIKMIIFRQFLYPK